MPTDTTNPATDNIATQLAAFAHGLKHDMLPAAVVEQAKLLMLDALGIALASSQHDFAHCTYRGLHALGGAGDSAVMGAFAPLPLRDAVLMNGILVHGLDFDDTHPGAITHPSASAFPLALGLAAQRHATGAEMITAYVLAIEVVARLGAAARGGFHDVGFHPTGLVGAFGCALAAGKLMGLDQVGLAHAQGVVLSMASGSMEFLSDGAWTKRMHPGWAGVSGLTASALACAGYRGPSQPYEGRFGLYASHLAARGLNADLSLCTRGLGGCWELMEVAVKLYPTCHFTHASIDAALALRAAGLRAEEIASVQVLLPQGVHPVVCEPVAAKRRPANVYESQFSIHHLVAVALLRGQLGLAELDAANLADPQIQALADRIEHLADSDADYPTFFSGELRVRTRDGREFRRRESAHRGAPDRPITAADIEAKFMGNALPALPRDQALRLRDAVLSADRAPDAAILAQTLTQFNNTPGAL
ncbi:MAG: 2-methylcitrate dehydratase [Burkholderiales bacterium RIFCSPLOWO2_12_FULL_67_210]|jgi:2-methylcitrate dehydratase PrpD|nr:MAG: 2-methylcitrate dehydratase [Burkholderiales bacterium RIFCSPLOWO2_12_FULL_67_210]